MYRGRHRVILLARVGAPGPLQSHEVVIETIRAVTTTHRTDRARRTRRGHLSPRHQNHRQGHEGPGNHRDPEPSLLPRRLELHDFTRDTLKVNPPKYCANPNPT